MRLLMSSAFLALSAGVATAGGVDAIGANVFSMLKLAVEVIAGRGEEEFETAARG
jgi:hypothetical protein